MHTILRLNTIVRRHTGGRLRPDLEDADWPDGSDHGWPRVWGETGLRASECAGLAASSFPRLLAKASCASSSSTAPLIGRAMRDERDRQAPTALWKWPRACERHIPHPESIRAARQNTVFRAAVTASPGNWCLQHVALRVLKHILENFQRILNGALFAPHLQISRQINAFTGKASKVGYGGLHVCFNSRCAGSKKSTSESTQSTTQSPTESIAQSVT